MPSYAEECPNCRLSSDVDPYLSMSIHVHPMKKDCQKDRKVSQFPWGDDMSPRYRLSHQSAPATSYSTLVARSYVESLALSSWQSCSKSSDDFRRHSCGSCPSDFMLLFIVFHCRLHSTKDPELIARQALDGTNRYRASKAGNVNGPFGPCHSTDRTGSFLSSKAVVPNPIWRSKHVDPIHGIHAHH